MLGKLNRNTRTILILQSLGMFIGTTTHVLWLVNNGFLSEKYNVSFYSKLFWDSLTFLDPIAAVLLIFKPKLGIWLTAIIIVVDVFHNGTLCLRHFYENKFDLTHWFSSYWMLWSQIAFGLFVMSTFQNNLREIKLNS